MAGVGLIEILIAVVVLAFGLLGIAALQATTLRNSQSALQRSTAAVQTYAILDRMRANRAAAIIGAYNIGRTCVIPDPGTTLAASDLSEWITDLQDPQRGLGPGACGKIAAGSGPNDFVITVEWDDSRGNLGSSAQTMDTRTRL